MNPRPRVLVTGASRGIGKATALAFARAGFDVAITARTETEGQASGAGLSGPDGRVLPGSLATTLAALQATGARALAVKMDLLEPASIDAALDRVLQAWGGVDVLVNNAIYQGLDINALLDDLGDDTLQRVWQAYVCAPLRIVKAVLPGMLERGDGTVINVSSGAGASDPPLRADRGGWGFAYGAGKAALSRLAGVVATEYGDRGVRAFTVNPGIVDTEALRAALGDDGELARRYGAAPPELPAAVLLWLATRRPEADAHQRCMIDAQPFAKAHGIA
jgi:NAD(P)-dependent dehydrogenase (short-subunit alcohol dehydrogenase family)